MDTLLLAALWTLLPIVATAFAVLTLFAFWKLNGETAGFHAWSGALFAAIGDRVGRIWKFFGPRLTHRPLMALIAADVGVLGNGQPVFEFMSQHPMMIVGLLVLHAIVPLTPADAPNQIPAQA